MSTIIADHQIIIAVFYVENYDDQFFNVHVNMQGKAPLKKIVVKANARRQALFNETSFWIEKTNDTSYRQLFVHTETNRY